jgi:hypothetical protein
MAKQDARRRLIWHGMVLFPTGLITGFAAYANWGFCLLAAFFVGSEMLPLASAGHTAAPWQEVPVRIGLGLCAVSITVASVCVLVGLREKAVESAPAVH